MAQNLFLGNTPLNFGQIAVAEGKTNKGAALLDSEGSIK
jgi:hypothetical protein